MPIKLGNDTFWVDVQEDNKTGDLNSDGTVMQEDSIMLNLDMEGNGALNISKTGAQGKAYIISIYKRQKKVPHFIHYQLKHFLDMNHYVYIYNRVN
jgi:hypothetical protein